MSACLTAPFLAIVEGKPVTQVPADLFIPPDALEVLLEQFSGPLDLLLYLIRRQNLDILDIPIAKITEQYLHYIQMMEEARLELAADYLVMAAMLASIKSRLLLPLSPVEGEELEEDPRLELVRKLQIYEQFKQASMELDKLPRCDRDNFRFGINGQPFDTPMLHPEVELSLLQGAMKDLIKRQGHHISHQITRETFSVRERMTAVLERLYLEKTLTFNQLYKKKEGRMGMIVSLLAILELARQSLIRIVQVKPFAGIHLQVIEHD